MIDLEKIAKQAEFGPWQAVYFRAVIEQVAEIIIMEHLEADFRIFCKKQRQQLERAAKKAVKRL